MFTTFIEGDEVIMATRLFASEPRKGNRSPAPKGDRSPSNSDLLPEVNTPPPSSTGRRRIRRRHNAGAARHVYGVPVPKGLHEAIESERGNLAKAESLLGCLANSMEYESDFATGPYYPDVALIARDLVRQSINSLDSLSLQERLSRNKIKEELSLSIAERVPFLMHDSTYASLVLSQEFAAERLRYRYA